MEWNGTERNLGLKRGTTEHFPKSTAYFAINLLVASLSDQAYHTSKSNNQHNRLWDWTIEFINLHMATTVQNYHSLSIPSYITPMERSNRLYHPQGFIPPNSYSYLAKILP